MYQQGYLNIIEIYDYLLISSFYNSDDDEEAI